MSKSILTKFGHISAELIRIAPYCKEEKEKLLAIESLISGQLSKELMAYESSLETTISELKSEIEKKNQAYFALTQELTDVIIERDKANVSKSIGESDSGSDEVVPSDIELKPEP